MNAVSKSLTLFLALFSASAFAQRIDTSSEVSAVTLYGNQAIVKRTIEVELTDLTNSILIEKLPEGLQAESLQFNYTLNGKRGDVQLVDYQLTTMKDVYSETLRQLDIKLKALDKERLVLKAKVDAINDKIEWTKQFIESSYTQQAGVARATNVDIQLSEELQKTLPQLKIELFDAQTALSLFDNQTKASLDSLKQQKEEEIRKLTLLNKALTLEVENKNTGTLALSFSYAIDLGAWSPFYELHHDAEDKVTLRYKANVMQSTGEDWNNIQLSLSTTPSVFNEPTPLTPWQVGVYDTKHARLGAPTAEVSYAMSDVEELTLSGAPASYHSDTRVSEQGVNVNFHIAKDVSIKGNGDETKVLISEHQLPVTTLRELRPERDDSVALYVNLANTTDYAWLEGPVSIFIDNQLIAKHRLPKTLVNENLRLFLGQDSNIKLVQMPLKTFTNSEWGKIGLTYEKSNQITSYYKHPVVLSVFERVPVSTHEKVKVQYLTLPEFFKPASEASFVSYGVTDNHNQGNLTDEQNTKGPSSIEESQGILKAELTLAPSDTLRYDIKYRLTYPKEFNLTPKPY